MLSPFDSETLRTVAQQAPLSVGFPRQEYRSGLPIPSPGDLPNPGRAGTGISRIAGRFFIAEPPGKPSTQYISKKKIKTEAPQRAFKYQRIKTKKFEDH